MGCGCTKRKSQPTRNKIKVRAGGGVLESFGVAQKNTMTKKNNQKTNKVDK